MAFNTACSVSTATMPYFPIQCWAKAGRVLLWKISIQSCHDVRKPIFYRTAAGAEIDLVLKMPSSETWAVEIKHSVNPKLDKHYSQTCNDVGATRKYILYSGDDEFPIGNGVTIISLPRLMEKLQSI